MRRDGHDLAARTAAKLSGSTTPSTVDETAGAGDGRHGALGGAVDEHGGLDGERSLRSLASSSAC